MHLNRLQTHGLGVVHVIFFAPAYSVLPEEARQVVSASWAYLVENPVSY
jgi:hypothetical protein